MKKLSDNVSGSAAMVGAVIAGLVAIIIGVMVWYKLNTSIYSAFRFGTGTGSHTAANATYAAINTTADTIWTLFPIVAIVVIAGVILAIVMGFGRQNA